MTDDQLYRDYLDGNSTAGDRLMLRYGDSLTAYLDGFLHDPQDAEDIMLDCFASIFVDRPRIGEGKFRAYLFRTAWHKACRMRKLRSKRQEFCLDETLIDTVADGDDTPVEAAARAERNAALRRCLNRIAPQYREALWLVYVMEMSYANAASVLDCGVKRVENLLYNGKARLRAELEKEGITNADI